MSRLGELPSGSNEIQYRKALPKQKRSWIQLIDGSVLTEVFLNITVSVKQGGISFSTNQCVCLYFRSQPIRMQESQNCQQNQRENIAVFSRFAPVNFNFFDLKPKYYDRTH